MGEGFDAVGEIKQYAYRTINKLCLGICKSQLKSEIPRIQCHPNNGQREFEPKLFTIVIKIAESKSVFDAFKATAIVFRLEPIAGGNFISFCFRLCFTYNFLQMTSHLLVQFQLHDFSFLTNKKKFLEITRLPQSPNQPPIQTPIHG